MKILHKNQSLRSLVTSTIPSIHGDIFSTDERIYMFFWLTMSTRHMCAHAVASKVWDLTILPQRNWQVIRTIEICTYSTLAACPAALKTACQCWDDMIGPQWGPSELHTHTPSWKDGKGEVRPRKPTPPYSQKIPYKRVLVKMKLLNTNQ